MVRQQKNNPIIISKDQQEEKDEMSDEVLADRIQ